MSVSQILIVKGQPGIIPMTYHDLVVIVLAAATFVVGVIVPLAGVFGFILLRRDLIDKAKEHLNDEMKENGELRIAIGRAVTETTKIDMANVRKLIAEVLKERTPHIDAEQAETKEWGDETTEYGDGSAGSSAISK